MPMLDQAPEDSLVKLLLIADSKAGKTHWAMQAAELGFNVLYVDGDVGRQTLAKLSPKAKGRVAYMNVSDFVDEKGIYQFRMAEFFREFTTNGIFTWNDTLGAVFDKRTYVDAASATDESPAHEVWQIRPARMGHYDLIIFDSWTSYCQSISAWKASELGVDLAEIEKAERGHYAGIGNKATQSLVMIQKAPCHFIVIAHPDEYQKKKSPTGTVGGITETQMIIEWTKMVPKSTSRPHSLTMAKFFSDVAWIDISPTGIRKIDFKAASGRTIGGHFDDSVKVEERNFLNLVHKIGGGTPPADNPIDRWLTVYPAGTFESVKPRVLGAKAAPAAESSPSASTSSDEAVATPAKGLGGLTGLKFKGAGK